MTPIEEKEVFYLRLLPRNEMAEYICSVPYTLIESMITNALKYEYEHPEEDKGLLFLLNQVVDILKERMDQRIARKALRKLLKVCQLSGCVGCFDFGDWEAINKDEREAADAEFLGIDIGDLFDLSIKNFPEDTDKKDREMLDILGKKLLINRILSPENKYSLTRPINCKEIVRELLKNGYNQNAGFIFIKKYICGYHVEDATLQNYFRTCKKDIPFKK
jgi:hypothetical protein